MVDYQPRLSEPKAFRTKGFITNSTGWLPALSAKSGIRKGRRESRGWKEMGYIVKDERMDWYWWNFEGYQKQSKHLGKRAHRWTWDVYSRKRVISQLQ